VLANALGWPTFWFAKLGNGLAEVTNQLVTLAIWFTELAIRFARLVT